MKGSSYDRGDPPPPPSLSPAHPIPSPAKQNNTNDRKQSHPLPSPNKTQNTNKPSETLIPKKEYVRKVYTKSEYKWIY